LNFARSRNKKPFSAFYKLLIDGHKIQGKTAWRIQDSQESRLQLRRRFKRIGVKSKSRFPIGHVWIGFGKYDTVSVRHPGGDQTYHKAWWLPFIVRVWVANKFDTDNTLRWLRLYAGLKVAHSFGIRILEWGIFHHWEGVKKFVSKKFNIDLDKTIERHDKVVQWAEGKMDEPDFKPGEQLEAASLAERGLGRLIGIVSEIDKKASAESEFDATKNEVLDAIKKAGENKPE
jgi:hypothetical protein